MSFLPQLRHVVAILFRLDAFELTLTSERRNILHPDPRTRIAGASTQEFVLATFLRRWHSRTQHHISASQCETMKLADLLALADARDSVRWNDLTLGYTDPVGASWLRLAIACSSETLGEDDITCFAGAQEALYAALQALLSADDHAIVVLPNYPAVENLALQRCHVSGVALSSKDWSLDVDAVADAIRPNTRLLAISFPNNPTGAVLDHTRFAALVSLCRQHGIWLLSDEVYRLTERDPRCRLPQVADVYERGVSLGAVSKALGLPGLRIGWTACRDRVLRARMAEARQYLSTCSAGPSEVLACIAVKAMPLIVSRNRTLADANLALLFAFLERHPRFFDWIPPEGGVVGYVRYCGRGGVDAWVARMAETAGVLLLPSIVFRSALLDLPGEHFRIGFGRSGFGTGLEALEMQLNQDALLF